jgi:5'-nucleotidase
MARQLLFLSIWLLSCGCRPAPSSPAIDDGSPDGADDGDGADGGDASIAPGIVTVQVLAFNDFHGNMRTPSPGNSGLYVPPGDPASAGGTPVPGSVNLRINAGGAGYLAAHIKRLRALNPNTIVVSAGDLTGASPLISSMYDDEPTINVMNAIGIDYNAVGNHEFDHGVAELKRLQAGGCNPDSHTATGGSCFIDPTFVGAKFKYLAANVDQVGSTTLFPAYAIKQIAGAKVAFIGMTLRATPISTVPGATDGLVFRDEVQTVNALVPNLKSQRVDAIVVVLHQGGNQLGTYNDCDTLSGYIVPIADALDPAVDVIVSGHTHAAYNCVRAGKLLTSALSFGRVVSQIELTVDTQLHAVIAKQAKNVAVTRTVPVEATVQSLLDRYIQLSAPIAQRDVGTLASDISSSTGTSGESPLGDVVADSMREGTGAAIAFVNNGGLRDLLLYRQYYSEGDGVVTFEKAHAVIPFRNSIYVLQCTGQQILNVVAQSTFVPYVSVLQVSGLKYSWATSRADTRGRNAADPASFFVNGAPLDVGANYTVAVSDFLAGGGDGYTALRSCSTLSTSGVDIDMLVNYLGTHRPLTPPPRNRIIKVN